MNSRATPLRMHSPVAGPTEGTRTSGGVGNLSAASKALALLYMLGSMGLFAVLEGQDGSGVTLSKFIFPPLYVLTFILVFVNWQDAWQRRLPTTVVFLLVGATIAAFVSYRPVNALIPTITLAFNVAFAWWLAERFSRDDFATLYLSALLIMALVAVMLAAVDTRYVVWVDPQERSNVLGFLNIKGAFPHKIHSAVFNTLGAMIAWQRWRLRRERRWLALCLLFVLAVLISGSSLGLVTLGGVIIAYPLLRAQHRLFGAPGVWWLAGLAALLLFVTVAYDLIGLALSAVGRDPTLTGRTTIWQYGLKWIVEHPVFGSGLGVFFLQFVDAPAYQLWMQMRWYVAPSFHNGYIQALAEGGLIGATPFFVLLGWALSRMFTPPMAELAPPLLGIAIANTAASLFLAANSFFVIFLAFLWFRHLKEAN